MVICCFATCWRGEAFGLITSMVHLDSGSLSSNFEFESARTLYAHIHIRVSREVNATSVLTNENQLLHQRLFSHLCGKSVGETVVFGRLRFNPKAVRVLAYLLLILPPFPNLLPIVSFFDTTYKLCRNPQVWCRAGKPDDEDARRDPLRPHKNEILASSPAAQG